MFNAAWARPCRQFPDGAAAPFIAAVDVVCIADERVLERAMRNEVPLAEFNFDYWRYTKGLSPVLADAMMRSAAGLYTAAFVCGFQDKNGDDVGVVDGAALYLRRVRSMFEHPLHVHPCGSYPGRIAVGKGMREAFRELRIWDPFRDTCVRAFSVLREAYCDVLQVLEPVFEKAGVRREKVLAYLHSKHSLNLAERDRDMVDAHFRKWLGE